MYKHCRKQYNRWSFRLSVLGNYVDAGESYDDEQMAGCAADLAKTFLRNQFFFNLEASLSGEQFSALAHRRGVDISNSYELEKALAPGVKLFIAEHRSELEAYKDSQPPESTASKFRRSGMIEIPAVKEWVEKLESAEWRAQSFSAINGVYFFSLLDSLSNRLTDALKPLRLAVKMHEGVTDPLLVSRRDSLAVLANHMELNLEYIKVLTTDLRAEQTHVETAVANLEANRPNLA